MLRRIFFAIPDIAHARSIVSELESAGIGKDHIHASSKVGTPLPGLQGAPAARRGDCVEFLDRLLWNGDLLAFTAGTLALGLAAYYASTLWALAALAVMLASYAFGHWFFTKIPHTHLSDLRVPLEHGEVVLMVDVPRDRLRETEQVVSRRHPEAEMGGVGWTSPMFGT